MTSSSSGLFSVGGLASGLDTNSIITQLMQIESQPKTRMQWNKDLWSTRQSIWKNINTQLSKLGTAAQALNTPSTWTGATGATSSDPTKLTASVVGSPAAGTYSVDIANLAADEVWSAANQLTGVTGAHPGVRQSGSWYQSAFTEAGAGTQLTALTDIDGTGLGLTAGSKITMSYSVAGSPSSATYTVGAGDTLQDLVNWAQSQVPGSSFGVNGDGSVTFTSPSGTSNEITALSFSAVDAFNAALPVFNGTAGASTSQTVAASDGTGGLAANDTLTITQGANVWNINLSAGDDETAIAAKINGTSGIGVQASVVSGKLQITSTVQGAAGAFSISGGTAMTELGLAETTAAADANFTVGGTNYTRSKNTANYPATEVH